MFIKWFEMFLNNYKKLFGQLWIGGKLHHQESVWLKIRMSEFDILLVLK